MPLLELLLLFCILSSGMNLKQGKQSTVFEHKLKFPLSIKYLPGFFRQHMVPLLIEVDLFNFSPNSL